VYRYSASISVYDMAADAIDEYLKLGKSIVLKCLEYYCPSIIEYFGDEYHMEYYLTDGIYPS
jgi:hypothetical protein